MCGQRCKENIKGIKKKKTNLGNYTFHKLDTDMS